jgi:hypothetical protein
MATTAGGQTTAAMTFATKVTQFHNQRFPDSQLRWGMQFGGATGVIHWTMDVPDLATLQQIFTALMGDGEYLSMIDSVGGVFVPGTVHDTMVVMM